MTTGEKDFVRGSRSAVTREGRNGYSSREDYFRQKCARIHEKEGGRDVVSSIFRGVRIYINGFTDPPIEELKRLICEHGGSYHYFYVRNSVTHVIASGVSAAKVQEERKHERFVPYVYPSWIVESIRSHRCLPFEQFLLPEFRSIVGPSVFSHFASAETPVASATSVASAAPFVSTLCGVPVSEFYKNSRLHMMGQIKQKFKQRLIAAPPEDSLSPFLVHVDFDCFFAQVALLHHPDHQRDPVVIASSPNSMHGAVSSSNYVARKFGVHSGMGLEQAYARCKSLVVLPYYFEDIMRISQQFYEILLSFTSRLEVISCDECLLDLGDQDFPEKTASEIRSRVRLETGCTCSAGMGSNRILAKMALKRAKPDGQYTLESSEFASLVESLPVSSLPGVGYHTESLLSMHLVKTCGDLRAVDQNTLQQWFGPRMGMTLFNRVRGIDSSGLERHQTPKSLSAQATWGVRCSNDGHVRSFLHELARELERKLLENNVLGSSLTVVLMQRSDGAGEATMYLGHGHCDRKTKTVGISETQQCEKLLEVALSVFGQFRCPPRDVRGLGLSLSKLKPKTLVTQDLVACFASAGKSRDSEAAVPVVSSDGFLSPSQVSEDVLEELPESLRRAYKRSLRVYNATKSIGKRRRLSACAQAAPVPTVEESLPELAASDLSAESLAAFSPSARHRIIASSLRAQSSSDPWWLSHLQQRNPWTSVKNALQLWSRSTPADAARNRLVERSVEYMCESDLEHLGIFCQFLVHLRLVPGASELRQRVARLLSARYHSTAHLRF